MSIIIVPIVFLIANGKKNSFLPNDRDDQISAFVAASLTSENETVNNQLLKN